ncbi:hypothetical protein MLD52_22010 [Puniceicoccaceae bacterium K14]|nr:hypothetical protein [Puniceicoccaceae bacterium K14]
MKKVRLGFLLNVTLSFGALVVIAATQPPNGLFSKSLIPSGTETRIEQEKTKREQLSPNTYSEDFSNFSGDFLGNGDKLEGTDFWFEGAMSGSTAAIVDGHLLVDANRKGNVGTVWLDKDFNGDVQIEFDVHIVESFIDSNNMNFFFCFKSRSGTDLYSTRKTRLTGEYSNYHGKDDSGADLTGYILTHLANGTPESPRYRLRDVPTFDPYLAEMSGIGTARSGQTYSIKILKQGNRIQY